MDNDDLFDIILDSLTKIPVDNQYYILDIYRIIMSFIQLNEHLIHPALSGLLSLTFILGITHINYIINKQFKLTDNFLITICSFYTLLGFVSSITLLIVLLE